MKQDYSSWGVSELIERIEELENQMRGSVYTLKGGVTVLPDIDSEVERIMALPEDEQKQSYALLVLTHEQALERFKSMLGETQNHNAYMEYLEAFLDKLQAKIK